MTEEDFKNKMSLNKAQQEATRVRLEENAKQTKACLSLMDRVNKLLGIKLKSNKYLSFEFHDRLRDEKE
jgi:hypothetical protein